VPLWEPTFLSTAECPLLRADFSLGRTPFGYPLGPTRFTGPRPLRFCATRFRGGTFAWGPPWFHRGAFDLPPPRRSPKGALSLPGRLRAVLGASIHAPRDRRRGHNALAPPPARLAERIDDALLLGQAHDTSRSSSPSSAPLTSAPARPLCPPPRRPRSRGEAL